MEKNNFTENEDTPGIFNVKRKFSMKIFHRCFQISLGDAGDGHGGRESGPHLVGSLGRAINFTLVYENPASHCFSVRPAWLLPLGERSLRSVVSSWMLSGFVFRLMLWFPK